MDEVKPQDLFMRDFVKQCGKWVKNGEQIFIVMDGNDHAVDGELTQMLSAEGIDLEEFSHNYWGDEPQIVYSEHVRKGKKHMTMIDLS